jgi:hypothetical protein
MGRAGAEDYMQLFEVDAPWTTVQQHVSVFKIYPEFIRRASDDDIRKLVVGLAERHIDLAVESQVLGPTGWCEPGHPRSQFIAPLMARLKRLGADVRYLAMVGPLVDGHTSTDKFRCHLPISDVAADLARTVTLVREVYPDIVLGEIEPLGAGPRYPDWRELDDWFEACRKALGSRLAFLQMDVAWTLPWKEDLHFVAERARANGVAFGVIMDGSRYDLSDAAFTDSATTHAEEASSVLGPLLDQVNFQSWQAYPRHVLPEDDPTTMTGEIKKFLRTGTHFAIVDTGLSPSEIQATLNDATGAPIPGASVTVESIEADGANFPIQQITGEVPFGARAALLALRVQTECDCPHRAADIEMTGFDYAEDGRPTFHWSASGWANHNSNVGRAVDGSDAIAIKAEPGERLVLNSPTFRVSPGSVFGVRFKWRVPASSENAGFAAIIFIGQNGKEITRSLQNMKITARTLTTETTSADGKITVPLPTGEANLEGIRLKYGGSILYKPSIMDVPSTH